MRHGPSGHVHCWHLKKVGHILVRICCRCGAERAGGGWAKQAMRGKR